MNNAKAAGTPRAGTREVGVIRIQEREDGLQVETLLRRGAAQWVSEWARCTMVLLPEVFRKS